MAEIVVVRSDGERRRGCGYLVAPGWVLTAEHVVAGVTSIAVWFGAPQILEPESGTGVAPGTILCLEEADLALLPVNRPQRSPGDENVLVGRLDRSATEPAPVVAAGFPRFKLRPAPGRPGVNLREVHFATGTIAPGSNVKTGTLELAVLVEPAEDPEPDSHSPWEGMSGAAVFVSGRLVGVVGQHHPGESRRVLAVRPLTGLFDPAAGQELARWRAVLPQLGGSSADLTLATVPSPRKLTVRRAQRAAGNLAPAVLVAREDDLARLAAFADSPERWRWVQGAAFAGKTALLAWFVLHPPPDVDIAACFLRRTTGDADAPYALDVLNRQLAVYAERSYQPATRLSQQRDDFYDLVEEAARACEQRGRRLLVVVDGLDEDRTIEPGLTVARWLPDAESLSDNAWLLVASRAGVTVPLADDHPLRRHAWPVIASEAASELQRLATVEIEDARRSGGLVYPLLGLLAAAVGGLTDEELTELLHRHVSPTVTAVEISDVFAAALSRSVQILPDPGEPTRIVRVFAHEVLLEHARALYAKGKDLSRYHTWIDRWAEGYAQRGWPPDTPRYLLAPYGRQLADFGALERLVTIATDPARHGRMLDVTGGDAAALTETRTALDLVAAQHLPDLIAALRLAYHRDQLSDRNTKIPVGLPAVWAALGQDARAEALARSITDPYQQAQALQAVAEGLVQAGRHEQATRIATDAEAVARSITDPGRQAWALQAVAAALTQAGRDEQAEALARSITDPDRQAWALQAVAAALTQAGRHEQAEALARSITDPDQQAWALQAVAAALTQAGRHEQAEAVARSITDPDQQAQALQAVAEGLVQAGRHEQATRIATDAEAVARSITDPGRQAGALQAVAEGLVQAGRDEQAEAVARSITDPGRQARALQAVAEGLVQAGRHEQATRIATDAEAVARSITDPDRQARALQAVAEGLTQAGRHEQAEALARSITDPYQQARALQAVAEGLTQAGRHEQAEAVARSITDPYQQAQALQAVAAALARDGRHDHLEQARRLAAAACVAGSWTTALLPLMVIEPSSIEVIVSLARDHVTVAIS